MCWKRQRILLILVILLNVLITMALVYNFWVKGYSQGFSDGWYRRVSFYHKQNNIQINCGQYWKYEYNKMVRERDKILKEKEY